MPPGSPARSKFRGGVYMPAGKSKNDHWATPGDLYRDLDSEFGFDFDPCPLADPPVEDGLAKDWTGKRAFINPPYSDIPSWLAKRREPAVAVYLLPTRTSTRWWHEMALEADEIRFIRGRLRFSGHKHPAPFESVLLIYRNRRFQPQ